MKKAFLILTVSAMMFACDKDDVEVQTEDYSYFLEKSRPQFYAFLDKDLLDWTFDVGAYQIIMGNFYGAGGSDSPERYLRFSLKGENGNNQFAITTPLYDTSSDIEFNKVFGLGLKAIGDSHEDFLLSIRHNNDNYLICNSDANYQMEILKTEEIIEESTNQKALKVWIRIENISLNKCNPNYTESLKNGLVLAKFYGHKLE